jgi:hypothetical protein
MHLLVKYSHRVRISTKSVYSATYTVLKIRTAPSSRIHYNAFSSCPPRNAMAGKRIVFTGGSGKAGRHVIPELKKKGYEVLNLDLTDFPDPEAGVFTLKTDLTDSG